MGADAVGQLLAVVVLGPQETDAELVELGVEPGQGLPRRVDQRGRQPQRQPGRRVGPAARSSSSCLAAIAGWVSSGCTPERIAAAQIVGQGGVPQRAQR